MSMESYTKLLGRKVQDRVNGQVGVVTSISFDLYGCVQCIVHPGLDKDGKVHESYWYDYKRLVVLDPNPVMTVPAFGDYRVGDERGPAEKPTRQG